MQDLVEISKSTTDSWGNATVFIGNQPGGYKVSEIPSMYSTDIVIHLNVFS